MSGLGAACSVGVGACQRAGTKVCDTQAQLLVCDAQPGQPTPETCDGLDNDCDGVVDNVSGLGAACSVGVGECQSAGVQVCDTKAQQLVCDAQAGPAAEEVCDGLDNDCDGAVDDGVEVAFYLDSDGDGFGDGTVAAFGCVVPLGYASNPDDCDDDDPDTHPAAAEVCDSKDNNCNDVVDEMLDQEYHLDADQDGFGDPATTTLACAPPDGYVLDGADCDDDDGSVNPGAEEVCDGADNNCDQQVDEGLQCCWADPDCDDGDPCTADSCDLVINACVSAIVDSDDDGVADCLDGCPLDPDKLDPGICGCGTTDGDSDADGVADCLDACPLDPAPDCCKVDGQCDDGDGCTADECDPGTQRCTALAYAGCCHGDAECPTGQSCFDPGGPGSYCGECADTADCPGGGAATCAGEVVVTYVCGANHLCDEIPGLDCGAEGLTCADGTCASDADCCSAHKEAGCSNPKISACVCAAAPACCESSWTEACADLVSELGCGTCAAPPPVCGDGTCHGDETCETCALDCGACSEQGAGK